MTDQGQPACSALFGCGDIPAEIEDAYNEWYNTEHTPDMLTVPGVLNGRRFRAIAGAPRYAALYDLRSLNVMTSPEWQAIVARRRDNPSEAHKSIRPRFQNFTRYHMDKAYPDHDKPLALAERRLGALHGTGFDVTAFAAWSAERRDGLLDTTLFVSDRGQWVAMMDLRASVTPRWFATLAGSLAEAQKAAGGVPAQTTLYEQIFPTE
ncbi:hypothetical protein ABZ863_30370 [Saccharomonospora sp. NPDC046836]|uniref:hypothetical protein n=1 Tax=Saccharomonospora sp. NPDC046836 TaxID=3156921 RepID=UPI0033E1985D